jgi:hypothetical protein
VILHQRVSTRVGQNTTREDPTRPLRRLGLAAFVVHRRFPIVSNCCCGCRQDEGDFVVVVEAGSAIDTPDDRTLVAYRPKRVDSVVPG